MLLVFVCSVFGLAQGVYIPRLFLIRRRLWQPRATP
jgi:hypothetical protein